MADTPLHWTPCSVCEQHGWADSIAARDSLTRTTQDFLAENRVLAASAALYRCENALWHTSEMSHAEWRRVIDSIELQLPKPSYLPPSDRVPDLPVYLAEVEQLLVAVITQAKPGQSLPARRALCDRYRVPGNWVHNFRDANVRAGLLRRVGSLYITTGWSTCRKGRGSHE